MRFCKCGAQYFDDNVKICTKCGADMPTCTQCGKDLKSSCYLMCDECYSSKVIPHGHPQHLCKCDELKGGPIPECCNEVNEVEIEKAIAFYLKKPEIEKTIMELKSTSQANLAKMEKLDKVFTELEDYVKSNYYHFPLGIRWSLEKILGIAQ